MYEKSLDQYRSTSNLGLSPFEVMARIMDSASLCMANAARAISSNNIERRSSESEKALMLLAGLMDFLSEETQEQKKTSETLKVYYKSMMDLITNLNLRPDQELAETLSQSFSEFAQAWRSAPTRMHAAKATTQSEFLLQR
jgi:flagellin-specific chaperone FliS